MIMNKQAITLMELLLVTAVISVISVTGIVSFSALDSYRINADMYKIHGDLCWARESAVARHVDYIIDFDVANERYIIYEDKNDDGLIQLGEEVKRQRLSSDLVSVSPLPNRLTFNYPLGATQDKQVTLALHALSRQINVYGDTGYVQKP